MLCGGRIISFGHGKDSEITLGKQLEATAATRMEVDSKEYCSPCIVCLARKGGKLLIPGGNDHTNTTTTSSTCSKRNSRTTQMSSTHRSITSTSNSMTRVAPAPATAAKAAAQEWSSAQEHQAAVKCPRCDSSNTKFCYYNNYSLSQPRHFCKACKRYWTRGGTLRNMPVGGGCRKNKRIKKPAGANAVNIASRGGGDQRIHPMLPNSANLTSLLSVPNSFSSHLDASLFYALRSAASASSGMGLSITPMGNTGIQIPDPFTSTAFDLSSFGLGFSSNMQSGNDDEHSLGLQPQHLSPNAATMSLMTSENSLLRSSLSSSASASLLVSSFKQPTKKTEDNYQGLPQYEELQANLALFKGVKQDGKQTDVVNGSSNCSDQWQVPCEMAYYNLGSFGSNVEAGINATSDSSYLYWDVANYGPSSSVAPLI